MSSSNGRERRKMMGVIAALSEALVVRLLLEVASKTERTIRGRRGEASDDGRLRAYRDQPVVHGWRGKLGEASPGPVARLLRGPPAAG